MRRFVEGADRQQSTLFPEYLEDWICEDNPVRVIDVFVDELDLAELKFEAVVPQATGVPRIILRCCSSSTSTVISTGFSRAADLNERLAATLRSCGSAVGWFPITRRLPISARITDLRSARCVRNLWRYAERSAC